MSIINNINNVYNTSTKKVYGKLSFEVGQQISAKVLKCSDSDENVVLKLLDGWQFEAVLEKPLEYVPKGLVRFQIEGFVDGKLHLSLIEGDESEKKFDDESVENVLLDQNINIDKDDFELLQKMIKHNMPITKDNISKIKNIVDFIKKMNKDDGYADSFINKYLQNKGIEPTSLEGKKSINVLKGFFNELKNINEDEVLIMFENGIDLTEDNIKSFSNVFKKDLTLYKEISEFKKSLDVDKIPDKLENKNIILELDEDSILEKNNDVILTQSKGNEVKGNVNRNELKNISNIYEKMDSESKLKDGSSITDIVKGFLSFENDEGIELAKRIISSRPRELNNIINNLVEDGIEQNVIDSLLENIEIVNDNEDAKTNKNTTTENIDKNVNNNDKNVNNNDKNVSGNTDKSINSSEKNVNSNDKNITHNNTINKQELKETVVQIKEQISSKTEEVKTILRSLIEHKSELKGEAYSNVMNTLKQNSNDFKIFNTVSNQYYYMDLPINVNNEDYKCKLIIKDERKNGKKIDSREAKIAAAISTINMGTVDAYIRASEHNMNIEIKCEGSWKKYLESGKDIILKNLSNLGYNINIIIKEKDKEFNIINCREFFNDNNLANINALA